MSPLGGWFAATVCLDLRPLYLGSLATTLWDFGTPFRFFLTHSRSVLCLDQKLQSYVQGRHHIYPCGDHSYYSTFTGGSRPCFRCHPAILPRLFPKLFHRAKTKLITAIRNNGIFGGYNQRKLARETESLPRSPGLSHCQQISKCLPTTNKHLSRGDR